MMSRAVVILLFLNFSGCAGLFYYPDREFYFPPDKNGYRAQDVSFKAEDGTLLHGWFFHPLHQPQIHRAKLLKGMVVQFHGNAQNLTSHYASLAWLIAHGYGLFIFDYRGYGKSSGQPSAKGTAQDGNAALQEGRALFQRHFPKEALFVVVGQSLGGNIAVKALGEQMPPVDLLILESSFLSYKQMVKEKMASIWLTWPVQWMGPWFVSDEYAGRGVFSRLRYPLLVLHDEIDPVVSHENGRQIFRDYEGPTKEVWLYRSDRGNHVGYFGLNYPDHRTKLLTYLEKLGQAR